MSTAEEGLMALLEAMLTLAAREARRPKPPSVKPGGYPEEQFVNLTEEEQEEFTCSICYQILKECMQCINNHKFCHSCLVVWSTTGVYANRIHCPVCRTHGYYFRNSELDDRIGEKKVKCSMESCNWTGLLKHLGSHRHTTYSTAAANSAADTDSASSVTMPRLAQASPRTIPSSSTRFLGTGLTTQGGRTESLVTPRSSNNGPATNSSPLGSSTSQESVVELPARTSRGLSLNNSRPTPARRTINVRNANGPNRITFSHSRSSTDNNNNIEEGAGSAALSQVSSSMSLAAESGEASSASPLGSMVHAPRPPSAPRPAANTVSTRRLPRIVNPPAVRPAGPSQPIRRYQPPEAISLSMSVPGARGRPAQGTTAASTGLGEIRERLQESRNRLDNLMNSFSGELERSRAQVSEFAVQRERQRQDQLEEVRELGQRLGQVAAELRRLLDHRREAAAILSDDSSSDNDLEY